MNRRTLRKSATFTSGAVILGRARASCVAPGEDHPGEHLRPQNLNLHFNQSKRVVAIGTGQDGLIGIGEGGLVDTIMQCAQRLTGQNPFDIARCSRMARNQIYSRFTE